MNYLDEVFRQTADGGYFDFTRCQRPNGTFYGTAGKCKSGDQVGAREVSATQKPRKAPNADKPKVGGVKVGTEKRLMALTVSQLEKLATDKRLYKYQQDRVRAVLDKKLAGAKEPDKGAPVATTAARKDEKEARKERIREMMAKREGTTGYKSLEELNRTYKSMQEFIKTPGLDTPDNREVLAAVRALRMKMVHSQIDKIRAAAKEKQDALDNSPHYGKVPGSAKPVSADKLGDNVSSYLSLKEAVEKRQKKLDALEKLPWEERKAKGYQELDNLQSADRGAMIRLSRQRDFLDLGKIYEAQGYNAKPELVATRSDLEKRDDLITRDNGKPLVMYRGVLSEEFADQFRGVGKDGGTHFAGRGIFGNGTYAASATPTGDDKRAQSTAKEYAGWNHTPAHITAFGIRKDANVVDFNKGTDEERGSAFSDWANDIKKKASDKTGLPIDDIGHAAAIMGVHAYRVPQDEKEDYWVVLNRGALVAAADSQL